MKLSSPRSCPPTALALVLSGLLVTSPLASQSPAAPEGETFFESIDVEVVNVEVFVTDRRGEPVLGLEREDFELLEDGKPVPVTNFYAVAGAQGPAGKPPAPVVAVSPAAEVPAAEAAPLPEEQRLHLAVFIDDRNLTPSGRNRVLRQIDKFLAGRPRGEDRLLLVTYDGSLQVRQAPTGDPAALSAAMDEAAQRAARGGLELAETRRLLNEIGQVNVDPPGAGSGQANLEEIRALRRAIESFSRRRQSEIRTTLKSLGEVVDWLSGLPGRKALLYVSGGLSLEPGDALLRAWTSKFGELLPEEDTGLLGNFQLETGRLLARLGERANANRVTFYPLGAPEAVGGNSAEFADNSAWTGENLEAVEQSNKTASLLTLAAATGGLASLDADRAGAILERMRRDLDSYYSLGFTPSHARDGRVRRLQVRVRDRSLAVRHRESHRFNTVDEAMGSRALAALALDTASNPLGVGLEFGEGKEAPGNELTVTALVKFGLSDVVLVPRDEVYEGQVRLYVTARDDKGRISPVNEISVPIRVAKAQLKDVLGRPAGYVLTLRLRNGKNRIAVTLLDDVGKVSSTVAASYPPGSPVRQGAK